MFFESRITSPSSVTSTGTQVLPGQPLHLPRPRGVLRKSGRAAEAVGLHDLGVVAGLLQRAVGVAARMAAGAGGLERAVTDVELQLAPPRERVVSLGRVDARPAACPPDRKPASHPLAAARLARDASTRSSTRSTRSSRTSRRFTGERSLWLCCSTSATSPAQPRLVQHAARRLSGRALPLALDPRRLCRGRGGEQRRPGARRRRGQDLPGQAEHPELELSDGHVLVLRRVDLRHHRRARW